MAELANETADDRKKDIELVGFRYSPKSPVRSPVRPSSRSPSCSGSDSATTTTDVGTASKSGQETESTTDSNKSSKAKRRLRFSGKDVINLVSNCGSVSGEDETSPKTSPATIRASLSPKFINKVFQIPSVLAKQSKKGDGVEGASNRPLVAPKDMSVLERIAHKAHSRHLRVRKPHEVFVELEELRCESSGEGVEEDMKWEETARWIKFEEDVEEGSGRWGRPHISALAFHSLADLRRELERGCILLDLDGEDFPCIAEEICRNLVMSGLLPSQHQDAVLGVLLKRHKHTHEQTLWSKFKHSAFDPEGGLHLIRRKPNPYHLANVDDESTKEGQVPKDEMDGRVHSSPQMVRQPSLLTADKRVLSAPLLMNRDNGDPGNHELSGKGVKFSILGSNESLSCNKSDITVQSNITLLTDLSIDMEKEGQREDNSNEKKVLNGEHHHSNVANGGRLTHKKRAGSLSSVMSKIPLEAESLTVLVGSVQFLEKPVVAFVRLIQSQLMGELTEVPVPLRFIFLLLGPSSERLDYHEVGRAMATLMSDTRFHEVAYSAVSREDILDAIDTFLDDSIVLPPGDWDEDLLLPVMQERYQRRRKKALTISEADDMKADPFKHTKRPCLGVWNDLKMLVHRYPSDFKDAFHAQVFLTMVFMFFSLFGPAVAFGGLLEEVTNNIIGETETLLATGLGGVIYGLFATQPIGILAITGPLMLFETIIYEFSTKFHLAYAEWRAAIGLWLMLLLVLAAVTEMTFFARYFTRFSEEIFTGIISIFFIYEASISLYHIYERNPLCGINFPCGKYAKKNNICIAENNTQNFTDDGSGLWEESMIDEPRLPHAFRICNQPNTFLWSLILCLGTFIIAVSLRKFRQGKFLGKKGRRLVSDFGMLTAILVMVIVAYLFRNLIAIEVITVPPRYATTTRDRGWFINPFGGRVSTMAGIGAIIPAILVGILIFIENQLVPIEINKSEYKMKKGCGYHWDLLLVGLIAGLFGLLGIPWLCVAGVRTVQHLQALSVYSSHHAPGEKPMLVKVHEQRVTNIVIHALIILTPLAYQVLDVIPISVVLGIFFYLAYASINGVQLKTRIKLLFMPTKHHPKISYVKQVRTWKMHLYTIIQVLIISSLWGLKLSVAAMIYPLVIVFLVPLKYLLGKCVFTQQEINALDSHEEHPDHDDGEGEFDDFETTHVPY